MVLIRLNMLEIGTVASVAVRTLFFSFFFFFYKTNRQLLLVFASKHRLWFLVSTGVGLGGIPSSVEEQRLKLLTHT